MAADITTVSRAVTNAAIDIEERSARAGVNPGSWPKIVTLIATFLGAAEFKDGTVPTARLNEAADEVLKQDFTDAQGLRFFIDRSQGRVRCGVKFV